MQLVHFCQTLMKYGHHYFVNFPALHMNNWRITGQLRYNTIQYIYVCSKVDETVS